ncbi:GntR family transcriptional regulator [Alkaliphilus peptidifermentans]|uniref:GntR family transcriptional regulator, arabinose operon transcriptional repressor n=1 Tax=Alkaliphilus peptidifermentans DSM 18978 TaxID=1120976 RepID=A0A1G5I1G1_9FIRM|nr:GntR family transcriptional regulator [Alkaliphilus peptidifermentans]SCY69946.1 GntR family transcriptional regulator, arabinose operon transcriptional repressor [Alkaliphilus peptidifermentans DSM 18978]
MNNLSMDNLNEPKYKKLIDYIIEYIKNGDLKPNDKIFSELELMDRFNISRHTVRKAFDRLVNEGWLYKVQGKGTFVSYPSANLKRDGKLIAVVTTYLGDYIFPEIIEGIENVLTQKGYSIILGNTDNKIEKERVVLKNLLSNNLCGLITEPTKSVFSNPNNDIYQQFINRGIPIMFINGHYNDFKSSYIIEDDIHAGYIATKHLVLEGHERIGGIFKSDDMQGHRRYQGFVKCLREYNIEIPEKGVIWYSTEDRDDFFNDKDYINILLRRLNNCSAVVCYNDQIAVRILDILKNNGLRVPDDYSIVSFDNSNIAQTAEVKLTTVAHPKAVMGERAANALLEIIDDKSLLIQEKMEPKLVIRESTKKV